MAQATFFLFMVSVFVSPFLPYFRITIIDQNSRRGVPLVEVKTVNNIRYHTDSSGTIAFYEPGFMNQHVFFFIQSHGYLFPKDSFGFRGTRIHIKPGGHVTLPIQRINIAERLYRITGSGVYRDRVLLGLPTPLKNPTLQALVLGSDSVVNALFQNKIYWFWGDTNRPSYPLGNFHVPGATSLLPQAGGLDPEIGIELTYFTDNTGFARPTAKMAGEGPTWLSGLFSFRDQAGEEHLLASYMKVRNFLEIYERGLVKFNLLTRQFEKLVTYTNLNWPLTDGHPFILEQPAHRYIYFSNPYPLVRVRARMTDILNSSRYESFTCLQAGTFAKHGKLDRRSDGSLNYSWKPNTGIVTDDVQTQFLEKGLLQSNEGLLQLRDAQSGKRIRAHRGSVYWNCFRKRWTMIAGESGGTSPLGEIWYSEADTPLGPWAYGRKILTHDRYSFYNPKQHPMLSKKKGQLLFFEGTYSHLFSGNDTPTPRYDYNQIMYKLDLLDPKLILPVPIYCQRSNSATHTFGTFRKHSADHLPFFAFDRSCSNTVAFFETSQGRLQPLVPSDNKPHPNRSANQPRFHAFPIERKNVPPAVTLLYEYTHQTKSTYYYSTQPQPPEPDGFNPGTPLCYVWPTHSTFPLHAFFSISFSDN